MKELSLQFCTDPESKICPKTFNDFIPHFPFLSLLPAIYFSAKLFPRYSTHISYHWFFNQDYHRHTLQRFFIRCVCVYSQVLRKI